MILKILINFFLLFCFLSILSCEHPSTNELKTIYKEQKIENNNVEYLPMRTESGVKFVNIEINDLPLEFIFDTGASDICISKIEARKLYNQGTLTENDFLGVEQFQDATGRISEGMKINLKKVKIGNTILRNVDANIVNNNHAPLLLGQSALKHFSNIEIDNNYIILKN